MALFKVTDNENIRTIQMNRGSSNPINTDFINELTEIIKATKLDDSVKGVLLTGQDNFFSVGLDLIELYEYDAKEFEAFWLIFIGMIHELVSFDKPLVAAITGHAPAGRCVA